MTSGATSGSATGTNARVGVAVIGFGWMGRVHAQAYARLPHHFPALGVRPELVAVADDVPGRAQEAATQFGFASAVTDWRAVLDDDRVRAVSVTAPNFLHREIGVAVVESGRHLWIEKPVGLSAADARVVRDAAAAAGVQATVGFNYRNAPAVQAARALVAGGELGDLTHVAVRFFSDYAAHPDGALTWRFERERGGNGVLGDLASHAVDLARHVVGEIAAVVADTATFLPQRPRPSGATSGHARASGGELGAVENDDYVSCLVRFAARGEQTEGGGGRGVIEACRVSVGEQNAYSIEVHGTNGLVRWDFRRMNELQVSRFGTGAADSPQYQDQPVTTVLVGPGAGDHGAFQPGSGIGLGYDDLKVIEARNFLAAIVDGRPIGAGLDDAVASAVTLDAITESVRTGGWVSL